MPTPRRKSDALPAPQTIEEATALIADYLDGSVLLEETRGAADAAIAAVQAERDRACAPLEQRLKDQVLMLRTWWAVAAPSLTDGKRKSVELAGAVIGERTTPPALKLAKGLTLAQLVGKLLGAGWDDLVRTKSEPDKPAILKMLAGDHAGQIACLGVSAVQKDEFFIDRAKRKPDDPEVVAAPDAQVREAGR